jgi:hypothetical protein
MANYYTIVTPECSVPATAEEAAELDALLTDDDGESCHGFSAIYEGGDLHLVAETSGAWDELPNTALVAYGRLIAKAGRTGVEFGAAFTCDKLSPGSHGGTSFRIMADGRIVDCEKVWPE